MTDIEWAIILIGGYIMWSKQSDSSPVFGEGWGWPVPSLASTTASRRAVISQEFRRPDHLGVDIMYRSELSGSGFEAPPGTPILAARDGVVWSAGQTPRGWNVVLDHGAPWATFYQHLAEEPSLLGRPLQKGELVRMGQQIGVMGVDPTDAGRVRHLHFACWYKGHGDAASVDPASAMVAWLRTVWVV